MTFHSPNTGRALTALLLTLALSACGDSPFIAGSDDDTTEEEVVPTADEGVSLTEPAGTNPGDGTAEGFAYNSEDDTFVVDGLAFDGDNVYDRDDVVPTLGSFAVYENVATLSDSFPDPDSVIDQFTHRLIYGESTSTNARFAIVRTGAYRDFGFGGFLYERDGSVTLPATGQAVYNGDYAGLRDFTGSGGLEYVQGSARLTLDFEDFNAGSGVQGRIFDRTVTDLDDNDVTSDITDALTTNLGVTVTDLPVILFEIGPGVVNDAGVMQGNLDSVLVDSDGATQTIEAGNFYAIISGDDAEEIVGVVVASGTDPRDENITVRETGGFIVYR